MKVCFETFGCRLNKAEALQMEAEYLAKGWKLTDKHSEADLFVVRGCSVTARAQAECERLIAHLRHYYPTTSLRVCGCLEDSSKVRKLKSPKAFTSPESSKHQTSSPQAPDPQAPLPVRTARAYLKVQDGCSGACTFCIVPKFRGSSVSVPFTELIDRARRFVDAGYQEIVVTGCNLSLYASEGKRLPDLLAALAELSPLPSQPPSAGSRLAGCRIRLGSLEPGACATETVRVLAEHANICRFLHVPIQSGATSILQAMKRPYLVKDIEALVADAVRLLPGMGLGCDLMTGFPGETEIDFEATKGLLARLPFNNAHVFSYSERPGTPAAKLGNAVPKDVRSDRAHKLAQLAKDSRTAFMRSFVGKTVEVVNEDKDKVVGWTGEYLRCEAIGTAPRKSLVRVLVMGIRNHRLTGRLVC